MPHPDPQKRADPQERVCPSCGLSLDWERGEDGDWLPACTPLTCDAWNIVATLPKAHSPAAAITREAVQRAQKGQG